MRCPRLNELPPPTPDKAGWPWTEESRQLPEKMLDGRHWPRITIVTPSYNQGGFLEETIRSVLLQGYPNLEYVVMDGGSSDGSVDIVRRYERHIGYWKSEKDDGQSDALSKGFSMAQGAILGWINSDDMLAPGALQKVAEAWVTDRPTLVAGTVEDFVDGHFGEEHSVVRQRHISFANLLSPWMPNITCHQPGILFSEEVYRAVGGIARHWFMKMDYDLFLRMLKQDDRVSPLSETIAYFRLHANAKTAISSPREMEEHRQVTEPYLEYLSKTKRLRLRTYYAHISFVMFFKRLFTGRWEYAKGHIRMLGEVISPTVAILMVGWIARYIWRKKLRVRT
jgi:glycosyltransferase involved in cell wall biosynthesis